MTELSGWGAAWGDAWGDAWGLPISLDEIAPWTQNMPQVATYWPPSLNDGFGGKTFGTPQVIKCRWQDDAVLARDPQGNEFVSQAIVYPAQKLRIGGYLALGDFQPIPNPIGTEGTFEIRQMMASPDLAASKVLYKVFL